MSTAVQRRESDQMSTAVAAAAQAELPLQKGDAAGASWQIKAFRLALRVPFLFFFRVRIYGMENLPARNAIVCGNHLGWAEGILGLLFLPVEPRLYILGDKHVAFDSPAANRLINWLQFFVPVDPANPAQALLVMEDVIRRGGSPIVAPEGQLGRQEGTIQPLKPGAAILSQRSGAPIVPAGVTGSLEVWWRCTLTLRIGRPIYPGEFTGSIRQRVDDMTARLDQDIRALLPGDVDRPRWKPFRDQLTQLM